jgi:SAM-dependent methyltransferase
MSEKRRRLGAWLQGDGIEIGAFDNPLPVPADAHVTYVDRLTEDDLHRHYDPDLPTTRFHRHTVIGDAENLGAFADGSLDFVIANHLIEHLENPIRGLKEFERVLRHGGVLYLAVPDARVTFDSNRRLTTTEHLLDEWRNGPEKNRYEHYRDYVENADRVVFAGTRTDTVDERVAYWIEIGYSIHVHVWRPDTFLEFLHAAKAEAGLDFELVAFEAQDEVPDNEFILVLAKGQSDVPRRPPLRAPVSARGTAGAGIEHAVLSAPGAVPVLAPAARFRAAVARSPLGPLLRPGYQLARKWMRRGSSPS